MFVDVNVEHVEVVSLEKRFDGGDGSAHDAGGLDTRSAIIHDGGDDVPPLGLRKLSLSNEDGTGAVVERAGVSSGHGSFTVKHRAQTGQRLSRGFASNAFIGGQHQVSAPSLRNSNGEGFPVKPAVGPCLSGALLTSSCESVHGFAVDVALLCNGLAGGAHVNVVVDVPKPVVNHRINQL